MTTAIFNTQTLHFFNGTGASGDLSLETLFYDLMDKAGESTSDLMTREFFELAVDKGNDVFTLGRCEVGGWTTFLTGKLSDFID